MTNVPMYDIGEEVLLGAKVTSRSFDNQGNVLYEVSIKGVRGDIGYKFEHDMLYQKTKNDKKEVKTEKI